MAEQLADFSLEVADIEPEDGVPTLAFVKRLEKCVELLKQAAAVLDPERYGGETEVG